MAAKKSLYHSEAVTLGPIVATIKTKATKSKHANKPDYVELVIDGAVRYYNVENDNCAAFFAGRVGQTLTIEFKDSRESATVHAMSGPQGGQQQQAPPANNPPAQRSEQRRGPAPHDTRQPAETEKPAATHQEQKPPTNHKPDLTDAVISARGRLARCGNGIRLAADESLRVIQGFHLAHGLTWDDGIKAEFAREIAMKMTETTFSTLFISIDRGGFTDALPMANLDKYIVQARERLATEAAPKK